MKAKGPHDFQSIHAGILLLSINNSQGIRANDK